MTNTPSPIVDRISADEARQLAVVAQRLDRRPPRPRSRAEAKARILEMIRYLGCVQLDTISVVARSHETVLWSRLGAFDPADVATLLGKDRLLFEYWLHAAAIGPIEFFPFVRRKMEAYRATDAAPDDWAATNAELFDSMQEFIAANGPVSSRTFEAPHGASANPWDWWGVKPERRVLNRLWSRGDLTAVRRDGFQRVFDLTDRVHPSARSGPLPSEAEQRRWFVANALRPLGVATPAWVADYFRTSGQAYISVRDVPRELALLEAEGLAYRVEVDGWPEPAWIDPALVARLDHLRQGSAASRPRLTTLLSPFDNLVWHRGRTQRLFGFDYRLESYTPAAKRQYGYYALPILHRGRLVGRLDPSYDRRSRHLTIKVVHLESGVRSSANLARAIVAALREYATFLGASTIVVVAATPPEFLPKLIDVLDPSPLKVERSAPADTIPSPSAS